MRIVMRMVKDVVKQLQQEYNYGKPGTVNLVQYCRPSAEKYLFSKLYERIFDMYLTKTENDDKNVIEKIKLGKKLNCRELMKILEFKEIGRAHV